MSAKRKSEEPAADKRIPLASSSAPEMSTSPPAEPVTPEPELKRSAAETRRRELIEILGSEIDLNDCW